MTVEQLSDGAVHSIDPVELEEWYESLEDVLHRYGPERTQQLLVNLREHAYLRGVMMPAEITTPYINTIGLTDQPRYPGNLEIERRIKSIIRWNALAMVHRANLKTHESEVGGHISTFASSATLYEVAYNHFFHAKTADHPGDMIYFQGHAAPGMYSRAFLEGRLEESHLENFRQEVVRGTGLSSYPHPWLMEDFWQFPTVSMGLGPICSIYHARFLRYLQHRGIMDTSKSHVWAFLGDGEIDEPESLGAIGLASREHLDNLIWVVNCNLQRLDGPVRGNGKIIQELEGIFRGAGWNCIKVVWGGDWDPLLARDYDGKLVKRMGEVVDGQYQKYSVSDGAYIRDHFFGDDPELLEMVNHLSDEKLRKLRRGGHDPEKVYAAFKQAYDYHGAPTVILAKTIKGYGLGEAGEGRMIAHNAKKMNDLEELRRFRDRFDIPISDEDVLQAPFYKPAPDSEEMVYLRTRREQLGGSVPARKPTDELLTVPALQDKPFARPLAGTDEGKTTSTTQAYSAILTQLLRDKQIGKRIVPIIPDEARTFGMEAFFSSFGIYSSKGQLYEPVDRINGSTIYYKEAKDGQVLEEGINEAGAMGSFVAAGTAYANLGVNMIPFYIYYSMFGFQRVGDLIWLAADSRAKGFLIGGTSGRTTLNGEGLQHEDGHSHLAATTVPNLIAYDPAYGYETPPSSRTASAACMPKGRTSSITSRSTTRRMRCLRCRSSRGSSTASCAACTGSPAPIPRKRARCGRNCSAAARFSTKCSARSRSSRRSTAWAATSGASPATTNCAAARCRPAAGTCCIPASSRGSRTWRRSSTASRARSSRRATTSATSPTRSANGSPATTSFSAPTASAAATRGRNSAATSRSTPSAPLTRPCTPSPRPASSVVRSSPA